jgi:4-amino-4-deoxy-L-arabinose transferase-like glycosyltransferase
MKNPSGGTALLYRSARPHPLLAGNHLPVRFRIILHQPSNPFARDHVNSTVETQSAPAVRPAATISPRFFLICILFVWAVVYVPGLFRPALLDDADSVHAEAAREMALRSDWVTLHANGIRYLEKAPLMYWAIASSFKAFGVSEWSARLPLALGALALLLAVYSLGHRVYGATGGFFSALVLATSLGPYLFTRFLIPDLLVGLWLTLTFDFFLRTLDESPPTRASCWGLGLASALNVLTKGLIGLVFPAAVILGYLLLTRNLKHLLRMRLFSTVLVFLAAAAPWHILAGLRNPAQDDVKGFFWFYFVNEHFLRFLNQRVPRDYDTVPLLLFWGLMLVWLFPWSAFLPQALARVPHRPHDFAAGLGHRRRADLVFGLWALVILAFFSFSTRQEYYVVPAIPALALLIGGWLDRDAHPYAAPSLAGRISSFVLLIVGIGAGIASVALAASSKAPPPGADIADLLTQNPDKYALSFGHFFDLTPQALGAFRTPLLGVGIALALGATANWWLRRGRLPFAATVALAAAMIAVLGFVHHGLVVFSPVISSKELALAVQRQFQPGEIIVIDGDYEDGSTLNFYTGREVHILNHREANLWYGSQFPDAPQVFEDDASFLSLWKSPARIYLWSRIPQPELLRGMPLHEVAHGGGKYILSNRP